jgi:hypothetical protein
MESIKFRTVHQGFSLLFINFLTIKILICSKDQKNSWLAG